MLFFVLLALAIIYYYSSIKKYLKLPSPSIYIPWLGHIELILDANDQLAQFSKVYKKYSKNGLLFVKLFGMDQVLISLMLLLKFKNNVQVLVGDYETMKLLFNNPLVQNRGHTDLRKNMLHQKNSIDRGWDPSKPSRGVILSQGDTWVEQRRSMLRSV